MRLAIDDFGNGCATLMKLKELPFAEMRSAAAPTRFMRQSVKP